MSARLDVAGIGSMVVDRMRRAPRVLGPEEKGILRPFAGGAPEQARVGGVVLNHLGWAAVLGLRTGIFGRQGDDAHGRFLRAAMDRAGIARHIVSDGSATSVAEIFVDDAGGRAIYMAPGATSETTAAHVYERHADFIRGAARLTTEVSQLPLEAALAALTVAREAGIPTVVDLDVPPSDAVPGLGDEATLRAVLEAADWLKPSGAAARELAPEAGDDPLALARALRARFGNALVAVTAGEAGCALACDEFEGRVPAPRVEVVDTTGAGDAFLGGLLAGPVLGLDWPASARLANACGAACAERLGAFPDEPEAVRERILALFGDPLELNVAESKTDGGAREALATIDVALEELSELRRRLDPRVFDAAVALVLDAEAAGGRVHVTGIGKPEHVAGYAASLLSSTGTPATFLHGTEVVHGSAGQVTPGDVVIAISNSGETVEMQAAVQAVQGIGARVIGVTGNPDSWLARRADLFLDAGVKREGGGLGLAPRASVAAELIVLAALSAALESQRGFTRDAYAERHPAGKLGEKARKG